MNKSEQEIEKKQKIESMLGDNPMLVPPVATGSVERDDESVGMSSRGRQVMSDRSRGRDPRQNQNNVNGAMVQMPANGGEKDFKKAYLALVEDLATKQADGDGEG